MKRKMTARQATKLVREAIEGAGYNYSWSYNDLGKRYRRVKCMQNGFYHSPAKYRRWEKKAVEKLDAAGVPYVTAGFEELFRPGYGPYKAFVVRLPASLQ